MANLNLDRAGWACTGWACTGSPCTDWRRSGGVVVPELEGPWLVGVVFTVDSFPPGKRLKSTAGGFWRVIACACSGATCSTRSTRLFRTSGECRPRVASDDEVATLPDKRTGLEVMSPPKDRKTRSDGWSFMALGVTVRETENYPEKENDSAAVGLRSVELMCVG